MCIIGSTVIQIIVGTETGTAEYVADELQALFEQNDLTAQVELAPNTNTLNSDDIWLICTSTHGAGDTPANLNEFKQYLETASPDLSKLKFAVVGLGDSSYDTYCGAAVYFSEKLKDMGAQELITPIKADAMSDELPEDIIINQLTPQIDKFK